MTIVCSGKKFKCAYIYVEYIHCLNVSNRPPRYGLMIEQKNNFNNEKL